MKDWKAELCTALSSPIEAPPLQELVSGAGLVLVLVPDFTSRIPLAQVLEPLVKSLEETGIDRHRLGMIVALGTHGALADEELEELVGRDIYKRFPVLNHDWRNDDAMVTVARLPDGTRVRVNDMIKDADVLIGVGQIRPHRISGYSGGADVILPGISGPAVLGWIHWVSAHRPSKEFTCVADNPIRHAMEKAARGAGLDFIVNLIMNSDGEVAAVFAGDPVAAHREGVRRAEKIYPGGSGEPFDIVVALSSSEPDLWRAASGVYEGSLWVRDGGRIILGAPCPRGVSTEHPEVLKTGYLPLEEVKARVQNGNMEDLVLAAHLAHVGQIHYGQAEITLVSEGVAEEETAKLGLSCALDLQSAVDEAFGQLGEDASLAVYGH